MEFYSRRGHTELAAIVPSACCRYYDRSTTSTRSRAHVKFHMFTGASDPRISLAASRDSWLRDQQPTGASGLGVLA